MNNSQLLAELRSSSTQLEGWLFEAALPLWTEAGVNPVTGAFVEAIDLGNQTPSSSPHRGFVIPRQIYCVVAAGHLGWRGEWSGIATRALDWYLDVFRLADDTFANRVSDSGDVIDPHFDLYNQAFVLFALAHAAAAFPDRRSEFGAIAAALLGTLRQLYANPEGGFEESIPPRAPLRANPHMHLLEAALAWEDCVGGNDWIALSDEIMEIALGRMIDRSSGCLREFFDRRWFPLAGDAGRQIEPGHHFEWAWLMQRWALRRGRPDTAAIASRLFEIGEENGICADRKVAILELNDDFSVRNPLARLWGQTEWLKAAVELAQTSHGDARRRYLISALAAVRAVNFFIEAAPRGLWRDKLTEAGTFVDEPAPASSFYHIVCAIIELNRFLAGCPN